MVYLQPPMDKEGVEHDTALSGRMADSLVSHRLSVSGSLVSLSGVLNAEILLKIEAFFFFFIHFIFFLFSLFCF